MANTQVDLDATSVPQAPFIDKSNAYNSVHVPAGNNRQSSATNPAGNVDGVPALKVTIGTMRFANPA